MSSLTPNYQFTLPGVNAPIDQNRWGGQNNLNWTNLDSVITSLNTANISATAPFVPATGIPSTGMLWLDTSGGGDFYYLKIYGTGGWATIGTLNTSLNEFSQNNVSYNLRVLTASGTYTVPSGLSFAKITAIGGGGAGAIGARGASTAGAGGGGGAGAIATRRYTAADLGASQVYVIGAAGAAAGEGIAGGNGGNTTFSSAGLLLTANGGSGAPADTNSLGLAASSGGAGGTASGGTLNNTGMAGLDGFASRIGDGNNYMMAGNGANTIYGSGGQGGKLIAIVGTSQASGNNASGYGSGGGGAGFVGSPGAITAVGGNGASGVIIVEEYF